MQTYEEANVEPGDHDDAGEHLQLLLEQDADDGRSRHAGAAEDDRAPDHEAELLRQRARDPRRRTNMVSTVIGTK